MFRLTIVVAVFGCALAGVVLPPINDGERIVNGEKTTIEKFPYQVALLKGGSVFCGGSLYSNDIVITAAHCLQTYKAADIKIRLGSTEYAKGGELVSVKVFRNHPGYTENEKQYDVSVMKLSTPVRFSDKIRPIELATVVPPTGTRGFVTGWGVNKFMIGSVQPVLMEIEVDIIQRQECASDKYKYGSEILPTMVCAGVEDFAKDACQGDSGGPLAADGKLVGIVSWGSMCARKNYPGVYSSVPELRSWIEENAREL